MFSLISLISLIGSATSLILFSTTVFAQANVDPKVSESGTVAQPQGQTGPLNTKSGGAPAASPQGETPAGMQAAPIDFQPFHNEAQDALVRDAVLEETDGVKRDYTD
jgi:hypothetical protein